MKPFYSNEWVSSVLSDLKTPLRESPIPTYGQKINFMIFSHWGLDKLNTNIKGGTKNVRIVTFLFFKTLHQVDYELLRWVNPI